jgi:hypothetical protein
MKAEIVLRKSEYSALNRYFAGSGIRTSNVYDLPALTVKLTAHTGVLYSIPEIIRFAKGVRVEI